MGYGDGGSLLSAVDVYGAPRMVDSLDHREHSQSGDSPQDDQEDDFREVTYDSANA